MDRRRRPDVSFSRRDDKIKMTGQFAEEKASIQSLLESLKP
jgi:hypothetical protein